MPTLFTRAEAEAVLPKVRPLLEDIQRRKASFDRRPSTPLEHELAKLIAEVSVLGVELKDLDRGLIDFRCRSRGKVIYLCWKLGEGDRIMWWHDLDSGFAGRRLIED